MVSEMVTREQIVAALLDRNTTSMADAILALFGPLSIESDALQAERDAMIEAKDAALRGINEYYVQPEHPRVSDFAEAVVSIRAMARDALALTPAAVRERVEAERRVIEAARAIVWDADDEEGLHYCLKAEAHVLMAALVALAVLTTTRGATP